MIHDGRLTEAGTNVVLVVLVACLLVSIVGLSLSLRRARRGGEIHAHADGTVHSHALGNRAHAHPTPVERYDALLTRLLGPAPTSSTRTLD